MFSFLEIILFSLFIFICIYALVDRICKCVEHCSTTKSYSVAISNSKAVEDATLNIFKQNIKKRLAADTTAFLFAQNFRFAKKTCPFMKRENKIAIFGFKHSLLRFLKNKKGGSLKCLKTNSKLN